MIKAVLLEGLYPIGLIAFTGEILEVLRVGEKFLRLELKDFEVGWNGEILLMVAADEAAIMEKLGDMVNKREDELVSTVRLIDNDTYGQMSDGELGALCGAMFRKGDKVVLNFGKPTNFVAMTRAQALTVATGIMKIAEGMPDNN